MSSRLFKTGGLWHSGDMSYPAIALYQPDIPGNTGAILRLGACLGLDIHVIGPAGFDLSDRALKRAGMDYLELASLTVHASFELFEEFRAVNGGRLVLATTKASEPYYGFGFRQTDIVLFGRESAGVPDSVHAMADARITIPMRPGARSLNLALSVAMVAGECQRRFGAPGQP